MLQRASFCTRVVLAAEIGADDAAAWSALESRAVEPNAYLSPHFVLPAARYLTPELPVQVFLVERLTGTHRDVVGVGVFTQGAATPRFPLPRLVAYRTEHTFLNGLLLDRACPSDALRALLTHVHEALPRYKALWIERAWADGALVEVLQSAGHCLAVSPQASGSVARAILFPAECKTNLLDKALAARLRDLDRKRRRLSEQGRVGWRWHRNAGVPQDAVEAFLALEHMGWKGEEGTSLRSKPAGEVFFREVVAGFASEKRAFMTELTLNGEAIASSCNFISGRVGFGFKIGWNPQYRIASPGQLNEIELMRNPAQVAGDLDYIDSGAGPDSWIDKLWLARRHLTTLSIPTRASGAYTLQLMNWAKQLKHRLNHRANATKPESANLLSGAAS